MRKIETNLKDAYLLEPEVHGDHRGFFMESFNHQTLKAMGIDIDFIQDNHSLSDSPGTIRGLHYQLNPKAQTKLVRVTRGAIYDVILDMRKSSTTYGLWQGFIISEHNKRQLLVPKGFAHGFCTLVEGTEIQYKVDEYYSAEHDRGIAWDDNTLSIDWPVSKHSVKLSNKDKLNLPFLKSENNFS